MTTPPPTCEICGRRVAFMSDGRPRKTCSSECRREVQSRHISTLRNRSGQQNCLDADGRLPTDPTDAEMERMKLEIKFRHLDAKLAE